MSKYHFLCFILIGSWEKEMYPQLFNTQEGWWDFNQCLSLLAGKQPAIKDIYSMCVRQNEWEREREKTRYLNVKQPIVLKTKIIKLFFSARSTLMLINHETLAGKIWLSTKDI